MNQKFAQGVRFLFFLSLGGVILWWLYKDQDPKELMEILKKDVGYGWIILSLAFGLLSHISRTLRWQMMIEPLSKRPGTVNTFLAVMIGYLANLAIPRMGEISRCAILSRYENISFSQLVGTVVAERLLDVVMLLSSLVLMILLQYRVFSEFVQNKIDLGSLFSFFSSPYFYVGLAGMVGLILILKGKIIRSRFFFRIKGLWEKFKEGLLSFKDVKNKPLFFFHTLFIFFLYFLMIYVCFFGFPFTSHLGPAAGLAVFVMGSLGMVAPVQGGIGPWHFMAITTLMFYGVSEPQAAAFALLVHGSLNGMIVITGLLSLIAIPQVNKKSPVTKKMN